MRISDWSSDVCSSDLPLPPIPVAGVMPRQGQDVMAIGSPGGYGFAVGVGIVAWYGRDAAMLSPDDFLLVTASIIGGNSRSEEHTSELQSLMRISYAVFFLKKKIAQKNITTEYITHT